VYVPAVRSLGILIVLSTVAFAAPDPWNAPRVVRPREAPRSDGPPRDAEDMPAAAPLDLAFEHGSVKVKVHVPLGNWRLDQSEPFGAQLTPSWRQANIKLVIDTTCHGMCDSLAKNIVAKAHETSTRLRRSKKRVVWVAKPREEHKGQWYWRLNAFARMVRDDEYHVVIDRLLPDGNGILTCEGVVDRHASPVWIDRIEKLCRELKFEIGS
jgi:hypothetical protein